MIGPTYADYARREIVGVVGDTRETGIIGGKVPVMYIPQGSFGDRRSNPHRSELEDRMEFAWPRPP